MALRKEPAIPLRRQACFFVQLRQQLASLFIAGANNRPKFMRYSKMHKKSLTLGASSISIEPISNWYEPFFDVMAAVGLPENSTYALEKLRGLLTSDHSGSGRKAADRGAHCRRCSA